MDMDANKVNEIIHHNPRFICPFKEPYGYYIAAAEHEHIHENIIQLYWRQLQYAEKNIDFLVQSGFQSSFFDFYGVNQKIAKSPDHMCHRLIVDSFVLILQNSAVTIGACLSNPEFMFGHYIEYHWDCDWNLLGSYIC